MANPEKKLVMQFTVLVRRASLEKENITAKDKFQKKAGFIYMCISNISAPQLSNDECPITNLCICVFSFSWAKESLTVSC